MEERALERQAPCRPLKKPLANFIIIFIANDLGGRVSKQGKEKLGMRSHVSDLGRLHQDLVSYVISLQYPTFPAKSHGKLQELKMEEKNTLVNSDIYLWIKITTKSLMSAGLLIYKALALD